MVLVGKREYRYKRMLMSKLVASTLKELHFTASIIGVDQKHFQDKKGRPHYDICKEKKKLAIKFGAKQVENEKEIVNFLKQHYEAI